MGRLNLYLSFNLFSLLEKNLYSLLKYLYDEKFFYRNIVSINTISNIFAFDCGKRFMILLKNASAKSPKVLKFFSWIWSKLTCILLCKCVKNDWNDWLFVFFIWYVYLYALICVFYKIFFIEKLLLFIEGLTTEVVFSTKVEEVGRK